MACLLGGVFILHLFLRLMGPALIGLYY